MAVQHHRLKRHFRAARGHPAAAVLLAVLQNTASPTAAATAWPRAADASWPSPALAAAGVNLRNPRAASTPTPSLARLPCPLDAGWETLLSLRLPRQDVAGRPSGGFSAVVYDPSTDVLELLSDAPHGFVQRWGGLLPLVAAAQQGRAQPSPALQLRSVLALRSGDARLPREMDGEGLVRLGSDLWVASEGRRSATRPAQLLRFEPGTGVLRQALELPTAWQPAPGRGLEANKGPESLTLWRRPGRADKLLMASETALLQDPADQVRLLEWDLSDSGASASPLRSLALPRGGLWSLTELLALPQPQGEARVLALLRRFEEPDRWGARLLLYPLPAQPITARSQATKIPLRGAKTWSTVAGTGAAALAADGDVEKPDGPLPPIHSWDLLARGPGKPGLPPDNWEGLTWGPTLVDGRVTLVLVTDDNFSPFQDNWIAVLAPRRLAHCRANRSQRPRQQAAMVRGAIVASS